MARASDKKTALIDPGGAAYTGGLEDFRQNNDLFSPADVILTPRASTPYPARERSSPSPATRP